jgi:uncharacterized protein (TIGR02001 family)
MKKMALVATVLAMTTGSTFAADLPVKALKAPPAPAFEPWDFAFGSAIVSDYVFRGVTQSNHKPSVAAYFEPRYNINKDVQLYIGLGGESISFPNRAAAEVDIYGGIRPTVGIFAFDLGVWGYLYPGGQCFNGAAGVGSGLPGAGADCVANAAANGGLPVNGSVVKRDVSFFEAYGKLNVTLNDNWTIGGTEFYTPSFLNSGAFGNYTSFTGKYTAPATVFGTSGVGLYVSGEFGRQWLGTSDAFYGTPAFPRGVKYADYNTWNIGVGFTYKVFTLDFRYSDSSLSKVSCNVFTSDFATRNASAAFVTPANPGGFGSNWCGATGIVKLSADLTAISNLK